MRYSLLPLQCLFQGFPSYQSLLYLDRKSLRNRQQTIPPTLAVMQKKISRMIEFLKKINDSEILLGHLILINILLAIFGFSFYAGYSVFSMLVFGEGANIFMYSRFN
jgi:hypothetical protein